MGLPSTVNEYPLLKKIYVLILVYLSILPIFKVQTQTFPFLSSNLSLIRPEHYLLSALDYLNDNARRVIHIFIKRK